MGKPLKAEEREAKRRKVRFGPVGATAAGQAARTRTARAYRGDAKKFVRKRTSPS